MSSSSGSFKLEEVIQEYNAANEAKGGKAKLQVYD